MKKLSIHDGFINSLLFCVSEKQYQLSFALIPEEAKRIWYMTICHKKKWALQVILGRFDKKKKSFRIGI
jgi:hypothetical protein